MKLKISTLLHLTLATPRGIRVTLNPKGGGAKRPLKYIVSYELAQMFSIIDLFFIYSALH